MELTIMKKKYTKDGIGTERKIMKSIFILTDSPFDHECMHSITASLGTTNLEVRVSIEGPLFIYIIKVIQGVSLCRGHIPVPLCQEVKE